MCEASNSLSLSTFSLCDVSFHKQLCSQRLHWASALLERVGGKTPVGKEGDGGPLYPLSFFSRHSLSRWLCCPSALLKRVGEAGGAHIISLTCSGATVLGGEGVVRVHRQNCSEQKHHLCDNVEASYDCMWGEENEPCIAHDKQPGKEDGLAAALLTEVKGNIFMHGTNRRRWAGRSGWICV